MLVKKKDYIENKVRKLKALLQDNLPEEGFLFEMEKVLEEIKKKL